VEGAAHAVLAVFDAVGWLHVEVRGLWSREGRQAEGVTVTEILAPRIAEWAETLEDAERPLDAASLTRGRTTSCGKRSRRPASSWT
jgi:hypothetical protein